MSLGLSEALVFAPKPRAVAAHKYRSNIPPLNGRTFSPGDTVQLAIPCGNKGEFLNTRQSYLKFKLTNKDTTAANAMVLDGSAHAVIRLLECVYGNNVLEYIDQYGALYQTILDSSGDGSQMVYGGSVTEGMSNATARVGASIGGSASITVCLPLMSGVLGSMQHKYLPIGDIVRNHMRLNITLAGKDDAQKSTASRDWEITDVEYVAEIVKLDGGAAQAISAANAGGYRIPMTTFSNHAASVEAGSKVINTLISGNYRSLKTLLTIFRKQSNASTATVGFLTDRTNPFGDGGRWQYDVAGQLIPQKPVDTNAEAFAELQKAFQAYGTLDHHGIIKNSTWGAAEGTYVVAQDLESQSHKSMLSESGVDVSSATIHLKAEFAAALASGGALRIDTFTHQDAVLFVDPSGMAQTVL
eukprot:jgi/Tetstr1/440543/TSEL_028866.t1